MKPLTVHTKHFPPRPYGAITLFPFVFHRGTMDARALRHETIHLWQQALLLIVLFHVLYLLFYVVNLLRFRQHDRAYRAIPFERSAYALEGRKDLSPWQMATDWLRRLG